jgi:hypothetical protein
MRSIHSLTSYLIALKRFTYSIIMNKDVNMKNLIKGDKNDPPRIHEHEESTDEQN